MKHKGYFIYNEHTLGYLYEFEAGGTQYLGVLHGSVLRGSPHQWGSVLVNHKEIRPATTIDFDAYRVCLPPDFVAN